MERRHHRRYRVLGLGLSIALTVALWAGSAEGARHALAGSPVGGRKPKPTVVKGAGDILPKVEEYRSLLGPDNGGAPDPHESGRRELNWDAVPDEFAAPNALPSDFFNAPEAPRARGAVLKTPGDHVAVSADSSNRADAAVRFGDVNPSYTDTFRAFSEERLFSPIGSNTVNLRFFTPGTDTPAAVRGFGAVYTDVDRKETASFEFFDVDGASLGKFAVPVSENGHSFLGVAFRKAIVARVRIVYGNTKLGPDDGRRYDVAVMDDFIFGEPQS
jgi:hypothetical protein